MNGRFQRALLRIRGNKRHSAVLRAISYIAAILSVCAFGYLCVTSFLYEPIRALEPILICGVPFVAVTVIRKIINAPRPYEIFPLFEGELPKSKKGESFPSRHAFSAFVIGTLTLLTDPFLGIPLLLCALAMSAARVLLGVHFVRDVVAGGAIGIASAVIGWAIFLVI